MQPKVDIKLRKAPMNKKTQFYLFVCAILALLNVVSVFFVTHESTHLTITLLLMVFIFGLLALTCKEMVRTEVKQSSLLTNKVIETVNKLYKVLGVETTILSEEHARIASKIQGAIHELSDVFKQLHRLNTNTTEDSASSLASHSALLTSSVNSGIRVLQVEDMVTQSFEALEMHLRNLREISSQFDFTTEDSEPELIVKLNLTIELCDDIIAHTNKTKLERSVTQSSVDEGDIELFD